MTRWTLRILALLILYSGGGVVTTVGVAWGLAYAVVDVHLIRTGPLFAQPEWTEHDAELMRTFGRTPLTTIQLARGTVSLVHFSENAALEKTWPTVRIRELYEFGFCDLGDFSLWRVRSVVAGWPCESLTGSEWVDEQTTQVHRVWALTADKAVPFAGGEARLEIPLPLRPIFPGFLVNTLFYASIWFGIFFGVATLRRFIRKKRGRCVKCSYDLRGAPLPSPSGRGAGGEGLKGCPECGWNRSEP